VTKSSGVERDLDLIAPMAARKLAAVYVTITTLDGELARKLEPRAAAPHRRLRILRTLAEQGVPCGVSLAPQIPFLTEDMEQVLKPRGRPARAARSITCCGCPGRSRRCSSSGWSCTTRSAAARIMARIQDMRGGKDYDATSPRA
jgi:hypothetical protein